MFDKKTSGLLILIILIMIILIAILLGVYILPSIGKNNEIVQEEQNSLYFVIQSDSGYGIAKTNGSIILEPKYSKIARIEDSVYIKGENDSHIFFLNDKKSVSLGGKETEVYFAYDKNNNLLPYYILRYGENADSSIYRIYTLRGVRYDTRDFASLKDAYKFLEAKEIFAPAMPNKELTSKYDISVTLPYPSKNEKTQYVASKKGVSNMLFGIVDETGEEILDFTSDSISIIPDSLNAVKVIREGKTYIYTNTGKMIEAESGFDFVVNEHYIIQKKGNTVNKIYNISGSIVVDGIYNYNTDLKFLMDFEGLPYMLVQETKGIYALYNLVTGAKSESTYTDVVLKYMDFYTKYVRNSSIIFSRNDLYYAMDLNTLKSYKLIVTNEIYSSLDFGNIYKYK